MPLPGLPSPNQSTGETSRGTTDVVIAAQRKSIKQWTRAALNLTDEPTITVTELHCNQSGCDPTEVMIVVFETDQPAARVQIHSSLMDIDEQAVSAAWRRRQGSAVSE